MGKAVARTASVDPWQIRVRRAVIARSCGLARLPAALAPGFLVDRWALPRLGSRRAAQAGRRRGRESRIGALRIVVAAVAGGGAPRLN
jgi:hypothetical protein